MRPGQRWPNALTFSCFIYFLLPDLAHGCSPTGFGGIADVMEGVTSVLSSMHLYLLCLEECWMQWYAKGENFTAITNLPVST